MALKDGEIQAVSALSTAVLTAALFAPVLFLTEKASAQKSDFGEMESIEASIAYKKTPMKQPQKKVKAPDPVDKPEGVSHDENKKVDKKPDEEKKPPKKDDTDPLAKFKHPHDDDDSATGKPTTDPGQDFNGETYGWASVTTGDPFWRKLVADFRDGWVLPEIAQVNGKPAGCFHITPEGKIEEIKFKEKSGDQVLDDSVQRALESVKKARNEHPEPVPTNLLGSIRGWVCFRFDPNKAG